ncbi:MAG: DUF262 domain-containing protein [Bacilli bacterium]|nr:DUF262 domain-containing protein [Bacilli bacterium]
MIEEKIDLVKIKDLLDNYFIKLPSFQRAYTWGKKEIVQFLKDIEKFSSRERYFIGNIFCYSNNHKDLSIIDGQQRITTLYLMLNAIRLIDEVKFKKLDIDFFEGSTSKFDTVEASPFCHYLFDDDSIIDIHDSLLKEQTNDFTKVNLFYCQKYIHEYLIKHTFIIKNIDKIIGNLEMVLIFCKNISFGYQIFENINSKGQPLNNADLIKTAFFNRIRDRRGENEFYSFKYNAWKEIERNFYVNISSSDDLEKIGKKNVKALANFHQLFAYYNQLKFGKKHSRNSRKLYSDYVLKLDDMTQSELKNELDKILELSKSYNYILNPFDNAIPTIESVQHNIIFLNFLGIKLYIPFAIALINKLYEGRYRNNKNDIKKLFCKLSIFHFVFNTLFSMKPSLIESKYNSLAHKIYVEDIIFREIKKEINEISCDIIESQIGTDPDSCYEMYLKGLNKILFTVDRAGTSVHKEKGYKKFKDSLQISCLLGMFEQYLKNDYSNIPTIDSVEHISCLKDEGKNNINNFLIFNFLPLEREINNECEDKILKDKIDLYRNSNYKLTKKFCELFDEYDGNEKMLNERWKKEIITILVSILKKDI